MRHNKMISLGIAVFLICGMAFGQTNMAHAASTVTVVKECQDWSCCKSVDKMRGTVDYFIGTYSNNELEGCLESDNLYLGKSVDDAFYLLADGMNFHVDTYNYRNYEHFNDKVQYLAMKVDDGKVFNGGVYVETCDYNLLDMGVFHQHGYGWDNFQGMLSRMKAGEVLYIEVQLFSTSTEQIARFSLMGFTNAYNWIKRKETIAEEEEHINSQQYPWD